MLKKKELLKEANIAINNNFVLYDKTKTSPKNLKYIESPNIGGYFDKNCPSFIIFHYTATKDAKIALKILNDRKREVSSHFVIGRDCMVYQLVPLNRIAWHAGISSWKRKKSLNKFSIGIEVVNYGKLEKKNNTFYSWDGKKVAKIEVKKVLNPKTKELEYFHKYSSSQITQCKRLVRILCKNFRIKEILGHSDVSPGRKIDPGPLFPISVFPISDF